MEWYQSIVKHGRSVRLSLRKVSGIERVSFFVVVG
jgi:hypothetical protein